MRARLSKIMHGSIVEANRSGAARIRYGPGSYIEISALLAQRHHDGRVALHRLLHDRRGAEAAPDDLVAAECVHVDNPEIDALTCAVIMACRVPRLPSQHTSSIAVNDVAY